jgi:hypothetical protein
MPMLFQAGAKNIAKILPGYCQVIVKLLSSYCRVVVSDSYTPSDTQGCSSTCSAFWSPTCPPSTFWTMVYAPPTLADAPCTAPPATTSHFSPSSPPTYASDVLYKVLRRMLDQLYNTPPLRSRLWPRRVWPLRLEQCLRPTAPHQSNLTTRKDG